MKRMHRTTIVFGWMMLGGVGCAGGDGKANDSAAVSGAPIAGASTPAADSGVHGSPSAPAATTPSPAGAASSPAATTPAPAAATPASGGTPPSTAAQSGTSVASGMFTVAQASHGKEVYTNACARCHMTTQHSGPAFASTWNNRRVFDLYDILYNTMPLDDPGSLSDQEYVDVVAYILQLNGHKAGKTKLPADPAALKALRIDIRGSAGQ